MQQIRAQRAKVRNQPKKQKKRAANTTATAVESATREHDVFEVTTDTDEATAEEDSDDISSRSQSSANEEHGEESEQELESLADSEDSDSDQHADASDTEETDDEEVTSVAAAMISWAPTYRSLITALPSYFLNVYFQQDTGAQCKSRPPTTMSFYRSNGNLCA